jgi:hypothetical protein
VELAIPWSSMGIVPESGTEMGFDVAVNDSDAAGEVKPFDWVGLTRFAQPARWGRLTLAAPGTHPSDAGANGIERSVPVMGCATMPQAGRSAGLTELLSVLAGLLFFASRRRSSTR